MIVRFSLDDGAIAPTKAHEWDAGFDLYMPNTCDPKTITTDELPFGNGVAGLSIDTGVHVEIPKGYVGMLKSKSGLNVKQSVVSEGVIDAGYTGSIVVKLYKHAGNDYTFNSGDKITQLVIMPLPEVELVQVDSIAGGDRGDNGFGSSGR